jgi:DNA repair protein RecO (recombination protein O)
MPFNLFQPMMVVDMVTYFRDDSAALNRLREVRAGETLYNLPFDVRRGAVAMFMAEICRKSILESEENRELFEFLLNYLLWLDTTPHPVANLHLHFLLHLSGFLGFQPHGEEGEEVFFDLQEGTFSAVPPLHRHYLEPNEAGQLLELLRHPLETCHEVQLTRPQRKSLLHHLLRFYQLHVPNFSDINTPEILEMVMEG